MTRITPSTGEVTTWPSPVRDPDGFAVRGRRAVLTERDHNRRSTEVVRAELDGDTWSVTERRRIRVPGRVVMRCGQGRDGSSVASHRRHVAAHRSLTAAEAVQLVVDGPRLLAARQRDGFSG
ncbi:hypothetical protein AB0442_18090 [Kitasatospora sp. NPDC085895]|uniref:hypothetical protein n=1 Tax=Kitasatospora sp. NPDC085895 TaxID=3155057 RepID=UPI00344CD808